MVKESGYLGLMSWYCCLYLQRISLPFHDNWNCLRSALLCVAHASCCSKRSPIRQPWFENYASSELLLTAVPLRFLFVRFFVAFFALRNGRTRIAILSAVRKKISRPGDSTKLFFSFEGFSAHKLNYHITNTFINDLLHSM